MGLVSCKVRGDLVFRCDQCGANACILSVAGSCELEIIEMGLELLFRKHKWVEGEGDDGLLCDECARKCAEGRGQ